MFKSTKVVLTAISVVLFLTLGSHSRDRISIVGSSTVFPFSTSVAETFGQFTDFPTPIVESTGSGGGMKLFCAGVGPETPDITNASRRIKRAEFETCQSNGITPIEVKVGFDGIVLGTNRDGLELSLTLKQIYSALAKDIMIDGVFAPNPYKLWSDIDSSLPSVKIEVLGPPPTSGTRDAFVELAMEGGAKKFPALVALRKSDKKEFKRVAHTIREDGVFVEAGENDNLIVQKIKANPNLVGIFGFSFLDQNDDLIQGTWIEGVAPEFVAIASGDYPVSRSLYFYVKKEHIGVTPGIEEFIATFVDEDAWGEDGYLVEEGLIPLPPSDREKISNDATSLKPLAGI